MSLRPGIFISAVSSELRSARQLVANTLTFLGYDPEWQEIFGTEEGDLRAILRRRIDSCKGVVQLVGRCYGAEPLVEDEQFGRVSYTQYEALYAKKRGKKVWYLFLDDGFPVDPHEPEDEVKQGLQTAYRTRLSADIHLYHPLETKEGLESSTLKLRDDLTKLRRGAKRWAVLIAVLLVVSVGLGLWNLERENEAQQQINHQLVEMRQIITQFPQREAEQRQAQPKEDREAARERTVQDLAKQYGLDPTKLERELPQFADRLKQSSSASAYERASAAYVSKNYNEAERLALIAVDEAKAANPPKNSDAIRALELAANAAEASVDYFQAMNWLREAEKLTDRVREPVEWADVQFAISLILYDQGQFAEAERVLREVVTERERALGPEDPKALRARHNLARALIFEGKYAEAEAEYRTVLVQREKLLGPENRDTLVTRSGLALALDYQGKYALAEAEYRAVLKLEERLLGPENPDTLMTWSNLATILYSQGHYQESEAEIRNLLKIAEHALGPEDYLTVGNRANLGEVLYAEGKYPEAESEMNAALKLAEKTLGPEHPATLEYRNNLAESLNAEGKLAQAEMEFRSVLNAREKALGAEHPDTLTTREDLAENLNSAGKSAQAESGFREVLALRDRALGAEHPDTLSTRNRLAESLSAQGKYAEAEDELRKLLPLEEKVLSPSHPETLRTCSDLASCSQSRGESREAIQLAQRAAEGALKVLGPEHPNTKKYQELQRRLQAGVSAAK
jgi:tetratricopeptide (TPR) repeat protein